MSNCYNQPCQWSTDNRTLRGAWTISFSPSWVSEVMWRLQLFSPCSSHSLEVTTEVALGWEQQEGKDEQHLPGWTFWFGMAAWLEKGSHQLLLFSAPVLSHRVKGLSGKPWHWGLCWTVFWVVFYQRAVSQASGVWVFVCTLLSLVTVLLELSSIHPYIAIYIYIKLCVSLYMQMLVLILIHFKKNRIRQDGAFNPKIFL